MSIDFTDADTRRHQYLKWPVGSVFLSVLPTNPAMQFGYGTWVRIAQGQFLVGQNASDGDFDVAEKTGGAKTKNIGHTHTLSNHTHTEVSSTTTPKLFAGNTGSGKAGVSGVPSNNTSSPGGDATQDVLNPYFVVFMWKRTT